MKKNNVKERIQETANELYWIERAFTETKEFDDLIVDQLKAIKQMKYELSVAETDLELLNIENKMVDTYKTIRDRKIKVSNVNHRVWLYVIFFLMCFAYSYGWFQFFYPQTDPEKMLYGYSFVFLLVGVGTKFLFDMKTEITNYENKKAILYTVEAGIMALVGIIMITCILIYIGVMKPSNFDSLDKTILLMSFAIGFSANITKRLIERMVIKAEEIIDTLFK